MSRKILIPLDGSKRAENVLKYIPPFIHPDHTMTMMLHVLKPGEEKQEKKFKRYLDSIGKRALKLGAHETDSRVVHGDPSEKIVQEAEDIAADLVAMCTHGATAKMTRYIGQFAQEAAHSVPYDILLVRPRATPKKGKPLKVICPLTPGVDIEKLEKHLERLFAGTRATVHLARIGRPFQWSLGGAVPVVPRTTADLTRELSGMQKRLEAHHVHIEALVTRGDPEDETVRLVRKIKADLVLAPTSRILLFGWRIGPLATRILSHSLTPVVLLRQ